MTAALAAVHATRRSLDAAQRRLEKLEKVAEDKSEAAESARRHVQALRQRVIEHRIADGPGNEQTAITGADVQEAEIDAEAAQVLSARFERQSVDARVCVEKAEQTWRNAVCAYMQDVEAAAIADVERVLEQLVRPCALAIAAAKISKDYGQTRGSTSMPTSHWFGPVGILVSELRKIKWPKWPSAIRPPGALVAQFTNSLPIHFDGVSEAETEILRAMMEGSPE